MAMSADGSRLHLQHGPIDLIIEAWGSPADVTDCYRRSWERFDGLLEELVAELVPLRRPLNGHRFTGAVAARMATAVGRVDGSLTPMAAVAGAVADEIVAAGRSPRLERLYVNNGGDIALHLGPGAAFEVGVVPDPRRPRVVGALTLRSTDRARGVATSGRHGRSLSLGIADAVTVISGSAALADAAATRIANAVDLPGHPSIERVPAAEIDPDSDLGRQPVTVAVSALGDRDRARALERGRSEASRHVEAGCIDAGVLCLDGRIVGVGAPTSMALGALDGG